MIRRRDVIAHIWHHDQQGLASNFLCNMYLNMSEVDRLEITDRMTRERISTGSPSGAAKGQVYPKTVSASVEKRSSRAPDCPANSVITYSCQLHNYPNR